MRVSVVGWKARWVVASLVTCAGTEQTMVGALDTVRCKAWRLHSAMGASGCAGTDIGAGLNAQRNCSSCPCKQGQPHPTKPYTQVHLCHVILRQLQPDQIRSAQPPSCHCCASVTTAPAAASPAACALALTARLAAWLDGRAAAGIAAGIPAAVGCRCGVRQQLDEGFVRLAAGIAALKLHLPCRAAR